MSGCCCLSSYHPVQQLVLLGMCGDVWGWMQGKESWCPAVPVYRAWVHALLL